MELVCAGAGAAAAGVANAGNETSTLLAAAASLVSPELSTRGFVWISSDRPDAVDLAARKDCEGKSKRQWEDVHGHSFQLWP